VPAPRLSRAGRPADSQGGLAASGHALGAHDEGSRKLPMSAPTRGSCAGTSLNDEWTMIAVSGCRTPPLPCRREAKALRTDRALRLAGLAEPPLDIRRIFDITESAHRIPNPFTPERLATLGGARRL